MKVLIIEDDRTLAKNLKQVLVKAGFAVDTANTRENGLAETEINEYDCIVLDINLPDGSGFDLLDDLRNTGNKTPVIIVTARGQVEDRIKGLNIGADDYLVKPFSFEVIFNFLIILVFLHDFGRVFVFRFQNRGVMNIWRDF